MAKREIGFVLAWVVLLGTTPMAQAQFAVIDVASLTQLMSQVRTLEQQVVTARNQLTQAQAEYQAITGARSMEQLLSGTARNYLPPDWVALQSTAQGAGGAYPALAADLSRALKAESVLSAGQLAALSPAASAQLQAERQSAALLQSLTHQALANSSSRFAALQQLIDAIARAGRAVARNDLAGDGGDLRGFRNCRKHHAVSADNLLGFWRSQKPDPFPGFFLVFTVDPD